ncbi:hypothetical protein JTB14_008909 [Gonioctena quinquepunctata]|nr:hypothetical protein JTB14_008909 [Gonioctena quinquepunctata]
MDRSYSALSTELDDGYSSKQGSNLKEDLPQSSQIGTTGTSEPTSITGSTITEYYSSQDTDYGIFPPDSFPVKCEHCDARFPTRKHMKNHKKSFHRLNRKKFTISCPYCIKNFKKEIFLTMHISAKHNTKEESNG